MLQVNQLCGFGVGGGSAYGAGSITYTDPETFGLNTSITSSTTLTCNFTGTAGRLLVAVVAADNNGVNGAHSFAGLTLASGGINGATKIQDAYDPGAAAAGAGLAVYTIEQTVSGANTATITFSPATTSKAVQLFEVWHTGGAPVTAVTETHNGANAVNFSATATGVLNGDFLLAVASLEARTGLTPHGGAGWSRQYECVADTGTAATSMLLQTQAKTVAADGSYSYLPTTSVYRDGMVGIVTFRASP